VGGATYGEGRVNIYNDVTRQWMPVCASGWTKSDSDVVCRQLGFFAGAAQGLLKAEIHYTSFPVASLQQVRITSWQEVTGKRV